jgi:hypothetical protein
MEFSNNAICKITGRHYVGFNQKNDAQITVEVFDDRFVFKNNFIYLAEYDLDDILSVDGKYEYVEKGSLFYQETEPKFERNYYLEIESFKNTVVLQVESKDELLAFINECQNLINCYDQ